jgi:hypothetical protein
MLAVRRHLWSYGHRLRRGSTTLPELRNIAAID